MIIEIRNVAFETKSLLALQKQYSIHGNELTACYDNDTRVIIGIYEKTDEMHADFERAMTLWKNAQIEGI